MVADTKKVVGDSTVVKVVEDSIVVEVVEEQTLLDGLDGVDFPPLVPVAFAPPQNESDRMA